MQAQLAPLPVPAVPAFVPTLVPVAAPVPGSAEREQRVRDGLPKVRRIARQLLYRFKLPMPFDDLCGFGIDGLMDAVDRYDLVRGVSFATFAHLRIQGAILDGVRSSDRGYRPSLRLASPPAANDNAATGPVAPTPRARGRVGLVLSALPRPAAWPAPPPDAEAPSAPPRPLAPADGEVSRDPEEEAHQRRIAERVRRAIASLPEKERQVVEQHYYGDSSFREIGTELGLSGPWAYRLHEKALAALREALRDLAEDAA
jgi:RNA polymerase sigma factor FliA